VRSDDLSTLFDVKTDGSLALRPGERVDFACWNATTLLALDLPTPTRRRSELITLLRLFEGGIERPDCPPAIAERLDGLADLLARCWPFVVAYGIPVSEAGTARILSRRRTAAVGCEG
jgi:hypothetical protein